MKKPAKKKTKRSTPVSELIKDNSYLHQYCDFLNSENQKNTLRCMELVTFVGALEKIIEENNRMLKFVLQNSNPKTFEKIKKEFEDKGYAFGKSKETVVSNFSTIPEVKPAEQKLMGLHDDNTVKCPNCKSISTIKDKNCKECGFKI